MLLNQLIDPRPIGSNNIYPLVLTIIFAIATINPYKKTGIATICCNVAAILISVIFG